MATVRTPKYRVGVWPITSSQWYNVDAMFQEIYADLGNASKTALPNSGVIPGVYGSISAVPMITVDIAGRITSAVNVPIIANTALVAKALSPGANINGVLFTGAAPITVTAAAGTLTGTTLNATVVNSSLTSVGTLATLTVTATITGSISGNATTVTTNANLTGVITSVGNATSIASQTGTGTKFVVDTSPTLVTPVIGVATGTSLALTGVLSVGGTIANVMATISSTIATSTAANYYGLYSNNAYNPSANSSGSMYAITGVVTTTPAGTSTVTNIMIGVNGQANTSGTGSGVISDMRGFACGVNHASSNVVTQLTANYLRYGLTGSGGAMTLYGCYVNPFHAGSGTLALHVGVQCLTPTNGGTITTNLGVKVNNQGAAGITHAYGLNVLEATGAATTNVSVCIGTAPTGVAYSLYNASTVASLFKGPIYSTVAEADLSYNIATPVTLGTVVMSVGQQRQVINPAGTIAVLTVTLPSSPTDGQIAGISFTQIVSALTVNAPGGATVVQAPTSAAVDTNYRFLYQASSTSWFPAA